MVGERRKQVAEHKIWNNVQSKVDEMVKLQSDKIF